MKKNSLLLLAACAATASIAVADAASIVHGGKSFLKIESPFQADPMRFFDEAQIEKAHNEHGKRFSMTVSGFGSRNFNRNEAAAYYLPGGNKEVIFDAQPDYVTISENMTNEKGITFDGNANTGLYTGEAEIADPKTFNSIALAPASFTYGPTTDGPYYFNGSDNQVFAPGFVASGGINSIAYLEAASIIANNSVVSDIPNYSTADGIAEDFSVTQQNLPTNPDATFPDSQLYLMFAAKDHSTGVTAETGSGSHGEYLNTNELVSAMRTAGGTSSNPLGVGSGDGHVTFANLRFVSGANDGTNVIRMDGNQSLAIVRPWNFGIVNQSVGHWGNAADTTTQFKSIITPEIIRSSYGANFHMKFYLSEEQESFWIDVATSAQRLKSYMKLNENIITPVASITNTTEEKSQLAYQQNNGFFSANTTQPTSIEEAFAQEAFTYGKAGVMQTATKLADVEVKLGYQFSANDRFSSNAYAGVVIPTGNKATAIHIAEPIIGNGQHFGIMGGNSMQLNLHNSEDFSLVYRTDMNLRYLCQNTQKRSFDIKGSGDWSRYMLVWKSYADYLANSTTNETPYNFTPGINVFTQDVKVTPGFIAHANQALHITMGNFTAQLGWNTMLRQKENVRLAQAWAYTPVFVDCSDLHTNYINGKRTIYNDAYESTIVPADESSYNENTEYARWIITENMLNVQQAGSPATISNTPFVNLSYSWDSECCPGSINLGASYEFAMDNSYIEQATVWAGLNLSF